jgi:hypothetical protein
MLKELPGFLSSGDCKKDPLTVSSASSREASVFLTCSRFTQRDDLILRRGARAAEWARLESECPRKGTVGSNPTLSAKPHLRMLPALEALLR